MKWWAVLLAVIAGVVSADEGETDCYLLAIRAITMTADYMPFGGTPHNDPSLPSRGIKPDHEKLRPISKFVDISPDYGKRGAMLYCHAVALLDNGRRQYVVYWSYIDAKRSRDFLFLERRDLL